MLYRILVVLVWAAVAVAADFFIRATLALSGVSF